MLSEIEKSKLSQIESKAESIKMFFGDKNEDLAKQLDILIELIKEERKNKDIISDILSTLANKV